ncbi:hypothetical protein P8C59_007292 [Phyllachora maydis]|uniref:Uncharacterized protein n=1 Tax=Phyllachora maydis TaxID=1825666 RepID=A0AAD9MFE2_9PEZI|nr:hypothetical protein P8C59_007292 [Phyllachora maydis]
MGPFQWLQIRFGGVRRRGNGRDRLDNINYAYILLGVITVLGATWKLISKPSGKPPVVIVTTLDESKFTKAFTQTIKENRVQYAARHGYETYFPKVDEYDLKGAPASWAKVVAMRHAMTLFPDAAYFWFLDHDSFVMNPLLRIEEHVMKPARLESLMMKDHPVVPPDSIIKTFGHLKGQDVDFVLTQDKDGLSVSSFIIRNGEWALFFFETWFDPIYRSYNFQKAEAHALEHIVQWHPTILSKLALIPQRIINSYNKDGKGEAYKDGDIAIRSSMQTPRHDVPFDQSPSSLARAPLRPERKRVAEYMHHKNFARGG